MIPELGQVFLIGALLISFVLGILPLIGASKGNSTLMQVSTTASWMLFIMTSGALLMLAWAFAVQDFSVEYVARHSNSLLPMHYRYSAVWSAHEGSVLLWELILWLWIAAVALFSK